MSYHSLVDHILLLRKVINNPEMTTEGPTLDYYIRDYCKRMGQNAMKTEKQQFKLPWQTEWIWHVHRLHPIAYIHDCINQLPDGKLVDKKYTKLKIKEDRKYHSFIPVKSTKSDVKFVPSINLVDAVLRQRDFLEKFKKHYLFSANLAKIEQELFETMILNYFSFLRLAKSKQVIVPTFDVDLIWHTHMRYISEYSLVTMILCNFLLDHDDSIEIDVINDTYEKQLIDENNS